MLCYYLCCNFGHTLFFSMQDIAELGWLSDQTDAHNKIAAYFKRHDRIWGVFLAISKEIAGGLKPVTHCETRYASWFGVMERNIMLREVYNRTMSSEEVRTFK